jgi:SAM-dependent methyltransferase
MMTVDGGGRREYCIWEHSGTVRQLYAQRCRLEAEEMTCAAQAAELLAPLAEPGESLLDAGCGSGYFYHSLRSRGIPLEYHGIDEAPSLIEMGRRILPAYGLPAHRLRPLGIQDCRGRVDHVLCMNVLTNIDNYHQPLERLLHLADKSLILRESLAETPSYAYVTDRFLDPGVDLKVYVNTYPRREVLDFIRGQGFEAQLITDRRTGGRPEQVIGHPHHWQFIRAVRVGSGREAR